MPPLREIAIGLGIVVSSHSNLSGLLGLDFNGDFHRAAADRAVLNVVLRRNAAVDEELNLFTAVGALGGNGFQRIHIDMRLHLRAFFRRFYLLRLMRLAAVPGLLFGLLAAFGGLALRAALDRLAAGAPLPGSISSSLR